MDSITFSKSSKGLSALSSTTSFIQPYKQKGLLKDDDKIRYVQELSDKYFPVCKGFRNSHVYKFACRLRDYGVDRVNAELYLILRYVETDFDGNEIRSIVNNAYR